MADRAVGAGGAVGGEGLPGQLVVGGAVQVLPVAVERGVDDAVQDEAADPRGEELGVRRAQIGAVRVAEVVQALVAEEGAHDVHVARRVGCAEVGQQFPGPLLAGVGEFLERLV